MLNNQRTEWLERADILTEALPNMRRYSGELVVIKYGGHAMSNDASTKLFAEDVALLRQVGIKPVVVHGGAPQINKMMDRLGIESKRIKGNRVTDSEAIQVVEMVLGQVNKDLAAKLSAAGARAIGLSGKDANWVVARKVKSSPQKSLSQKNLSQGDKQAQAKQAQELDLGLVGEVAGVDTRLIKVLTDEGYTPVVAPIAEGADATCYNINADHMAGAIASALGAKRLLILSDIDGVYDKKGEYLSSLTVKDCEKLIADKVALGGMIPKLQTCCEAIEKGADSAAILNGKRNHSILLELFTDIGGGSLVTPNKKATPNLKQPKRKRII